MTSIKIEFKPSGLGRIVFRAKVMTADRMSLKSVYFKLDTASDFTTLSLTDLKNLGYTQEQLQKCKIFKGSASTGGGDLELRFIENVSIKFGDREIQNVRVFFAPKTNLRSLFGCDILKYFNFSVNYDKGNFTLSQADKTPELSLGETPIHIYELIKS
ncbi:MAG: retropepsin-like domain-containing protein [Oscillospiraceae bacterium]|nr:retropepsin-like domain-containing protein [Oscillospiraceae bacterium]